MKISEVIAYCDDFDWDDGNIGKNWLKHRVADSECEEIFLNRPLLFGPDNEHSISEIRHQALGRTDRGRLLFVAFTIRENLIRPITARDMNARERRTYESAKEDTDVQG